MTTDVLTVSADAGIDDAAATLLEEGVASLVVVEDDRPTGMFTTTDLARFVAEGGPRKGTTVGEYATAEVVTVAAGSSVREAAARMIRHGVHHLPVTDEEGEIVGMLSTMDLAAHFSYAGGTDVV